MTISFIAMCTPGRASAWTALPSGSGCLCVAVDGLPSSAGAFDAHLEGRRMRRVDVGELGRGKAGPRGRDHPEKPVCERGNCDGALLPPADLAGRDSESLRKFLSP